MRRAAPRLPCEAQETRTDHMTRRPRTVSGTAGPGLIGVRLVPTVLLADADRASRARWSATRCWRARAVRPAHRRVRRRARRLPAPQRRPRGRPDAARRRRSSSRPRPPRQRATSMPSGPSSQMPSCAASPWSCSRALPTRAQTAAAYDAGANTVIPKPVTFLALVKLMKVVHRLLARRRGAAAGGSRREQAAGPASPCSSCQRDEDAAPRRCARRWRRSSARATRSTG